MANKQKMISPNVTYWWVPQAGGPATAGAITTTQINAGTNFSCAVVVGEKINASTSDKDTTRTVCDSANVDNPTNDNYTGDATFLRDNGDATPIPAAVAAWAIFKQAGAFGFIVRRLGKGNAAVAATADTVSVWLFENDAPIDIEGQTTSAPIQWSTKFIPKGDMALNVVLP